MPSTTTDTTSGDSGINWGDLISQGVSLVTTGVGAVSSSTTKCGQECRAKCKNETGWLFSGREKCKKKCKADCIAKSNEKPQPPPSSTPLIVMSIIILVSIGLILWWIFKKK